MRLTPHRFGYVGANSMISVAAYAAGDGTTDDTVALRSAITAAGTNGVLWFPAGKTFLVSGQLQLLAGQIVYGNNATIKRAAQVTTTTTATITNVSTSIAVTSAASFSIGQNISFSNGATAQSALVAGATLSTTNNQITNIVGNTITFAPAINVASLASGANVYSAYYCFVLADDVHVYDVVFDGNKANFTWGRWEIHNEIFTGTSTSRTLVQGCKFINSPGEGIVINGSYHRLVDCHMLNLNGNGVHFSGATHPIVDRCSVVNCNLDTNVSHVMGCVGWSDTIDDATVSNCYLKNGYAGIGTIDSVDNSNVTVIGNTIRNCTTYGIYIGGAAANLTIIGNRVHSCGSGANGGMFVQTSTGLGIIISKNTWVSCNVQFATAANILFEGNYLRTGTLTIGSVTNSDFFNNTLVASGIAMNVLTNVRIHGNSIDLTGDTTTKCINFTGNTSTGVSIRRNRTLSGHSSFDCSYTGIADLVVEGNDFRGGNTGGIILDASGSNSNCIIANNAISTLTTNASSWIGLRVLSTWTGGISIINNQILNANGSGRANYGMAIENGAGVLVKDNTVKGAWNVANIRIAATSTSATVINNVTASAISDLGTTTVLTGNVVV